MLKIFDGPVYNSYINTFHNLSRSIPINLRILKHKKRIKLITLLVSYDINIIKMQSTNNLLVCHAIVSTYN